MTNTYIVMYFKPSGKWYESSEFKIDGLEHKAVEEVRRMRRVGALPGLTSGTWDGFIMVQRRGGTGNYPTLIVPE